MSRISSLDSMDTKEDVKQMGCTDSTDLGSFVLPEGMEIVPWEHPSLFWLTLDGVRVAGPARRELLKSFAHGFCTNPDRQEDLAALKEEVERLIVTRAKV